MTQRKRIVGYVRVSTDHQAEDGLGLEIQERAIRSWATTNGHALVAVHRDEGVSGTNGLDARFGLLDALEDIRRGAADGLVVYRLDRLARDLVLQEQLLREISRMGGTAHSASVGEAAFLTDDPDDPSRAFVRQILGATAQYERSMIAMRLRAGRRHKAELGGYAGGRPPYGYRAEGRALVPVGGEQEAIALARRLHDEGVSIRMIAQTLSNLGFVRRNGKATWHPVQVARLLNFIAAPKRGPAKA